MYKGLQNDKGARGDLDKKNADIQDGGVSEKQSLLQDPETKGQSSSVTPEQNSAGGGVNWATVLAAAREKNVAMHGNTRKRKPVTDANAGRAPVALCFGLKHPVRRACIKIVDSK